MTHAGMGNVAEKAAKILETREVVAALAALAQDTRLAIFKLLVQAGTEGMAAGQVGNQLGIMPSSISFHMKELSHAGLVKSRQEGRYVIYSVDYPAMDGVMAYLYENCCTLKLAEDCAELTCSKVALA